MDKPNMTKIKDLATGVPQNQLTMNKLGQIWSKPYAGPDLWLAPGNEDIEALEVLVSAESFAKDVIDCPDCRKVIGLSAVGRFLDSKFPRETKRETDARWKLQFAIGYGDWSTMVGTGFTTINGSKRPN